MRVHKQKRPTEVAHFIKKFPIEERTEVVNCLTSLGLHNYQMMCDGSAVLANLMDAAQKVKRLSGLHFARAPVPIGGGPQVRQQQQEIARGNKWALPRSMSAPNRKQRGGDQPRSELRRFMDEQRGRLRKMDRGKIPLTEWIGHAPRHRDSAGLPLAPDLVQQESWEGSLSDRITPKSGSKEAADPKKQTPGMQRRVSDSAVSVSSESEMKGQQNTQQNTPSTPVLSAGSSPPMQQYPPPTSAISAILASGSDGSGGKQQQKKALPVLFPDEFLCSLRDAIHKDRGAKAGRVRLATLLPDYQTLVMHPKFDNLYRSMLINYHIVV